MRKKFSKKLDDFFGIKKSGSEIKSEIFAGLATFLAMAYILTVIIYYLVDNLIQDGLVSL